MLGKGPEDSNKALTRKRGVGKEGGYVWPGRLDTFNILGPFHGSLVADSDVISAQITMSVTGLVALQGWRPCTSKVNFFSLTQRGCTGVIHRQSM